VLLLRGGIATVAPSSGGAYESVLQERLNRDRIAPVFTPEVQFWSPWIMKWAREYKIDPDILATVIQIESCGHYLVSSPAGAQGLFQVMPFHFAEGENMLDPETNAKRGIAYLIGSLQRADGHIGLAMAGYNGGWGVIPRGWGRWATETRNYYRWGSLIYMDALAGKTTEQSAALQSWLNAGGVNLCRRAAEVLAPLQAPNAP
jgi:soluble lytic murein transglycosylase-like protein